MKFPVGSVSVEMIEENDRACWHLRNRGAFEPETLAVWGSLCAVSRGRTVIDVGAYTGLFAIAAAKAGCMAVAFEPLPRNARRTAQNAVANGVAIELHEMVLSDVDAMVQIRFNAGLRDLTSGASVNPTQAQAAKAGYDWLQVPSRTLDSFDFQDVAAIKIDVERAETLVLWGAEKTLARCKPTLIVEVLGNDEKSAVKAAVPGYEVSDVLDERNWLMVPC